MLEPRFNLDTLAMLLNIPPQKTLLRRHLTTNFNNLVGPQAQQEKREYTQAAGCTPLSITAKVKVRHLLRGRIEAAADVGRLCLSLLTSSARTKGRTILTATQHPDFLTIKYLYGQTNRRHRNKIDLCARPAREPRRARCSLITAQRL